jgi:polyisoprenoid-binding protein YceI
MKNFLLVAILFISVQTFGQATLLKTQSFVAKFKIKNAGLGVNGYFKTGTATILYDAKNIANSKFTGVVQVNSITTKLDMRDNHIKEKTEFFDMAKYPDIKMESTKIVVDKGILNITWNLTMKGVTKSITVPASAITGKDGSIAFTSKFKINRLDWGVGAKSIVMADNLEIDLTVVVVK